MKLSVIIPCHPRNLPTLPRTRESIAAAAKGLDVEVIVVDDGASRGPSWARNRGLDRATGDYVFFVDADDTVRPDFFRKPVEALENFKADVCFFSGEGSITRAAGYYEGVAAVREKYMPAFFGYSFDDVRRFNAGGRLDERKEPGSVWLAAFRRSFLERHSLRFEENMTFFEDAMFLSACCAVAERAVSIDDVLYDYRPRPDGNLASGLGTARHVDYKFKALAFRRRLDAQCGGALWKYCEASCVLSALELLCGMHLVSFFRYVADPVVRKAFREFPWSMSIISKGVRRS